MNTDLSDRLLFAVPKKGRLYEQIIKLLAHIDLKVALLSERSVLIGLISNLPTVSKTQPS